MRSPLAFLASLGASAAMVAAVAVSLLIISTFVALQGWPGLGEEADARTALVVDGAVTPPAPGGPQRSRSSRRDAVVLRAPAPRPRRVERRPRPLVRPTRLVARGINPPPRPRHRTTTGSDEHTSAPTPQDRPPTRSLPLDSGDAVRQIGDDLSSGVQEAGQVLDAVAAPLSPVVGQTLEELTELIAALLRNASHVVGAALDRLLAPR